MSEVEDRITGLYLAPIKRIGLVDARMLACACADHLCDIA